MLFYLFYVNELVQESPWNSAPHKAGATQAFAIVISAVTFVGGEGTCPVMQQVTGWTGMGTGQGSFQGVFLPWEGFHRLSLPVTNSLSSD